MLVKYIKDTNNAPNKPVDVKKVQSHIKYLQRLQSAIKTQICDLESLIDGSVSFVETATVLEVDKELYASSENNYCVKALNKDTGKLVYLKKSQLKL